MTDKTTLTIKPNEVVRFQFDHSNYADLSIDTEGNLTVHNLCGINPKIIDKTVTDETFTIPPTDRPLKVGDVLVCHTLNDEFYPNIKIGNEYKIIDILQDGEEPYPIIFLDDARVRECAAIETSSNFYYKNYFTLKP